MLTLTELFPKPLIETCALVMSRIATSEELANAMVGSGITNLIKVRGRVVACRMVAWSRGRVSRVPSPLCLSLS